MKKRELRVVETALGIVVHRIDVTGRSDGRVEKAMMGLMRRVDLDKFHVEDSADDEKGEESR